MKVLFDTCIIIDSLQNRKHFSAASNELLMLVAKDKIEGYISAKSVADIYYLMHKVTHNDETTRDVISKLFSLFHILGATSSDCIKSLTSVIHDYEDAIMAESALRSGMDYIVTRNIQDYKNSPVQSILPDEMLKIV